MLLYVVAPGLCFRAGRHKLLVLKSGGAGLSLGRDCNIELHHWVIPVLAPFLRPVGHQYHHKSGEKNLAN